MSMNSLVRPAGRSHVCPQLLLVDPSRALACDLSALLLVGPLLVLSPGCGVGRWVGCVGGGAGLWGRG